MRPGPGFSGEEDVFLWKFAVSNPSESIGYGIWKKFKQERQSERSVKVLYNRFHRVLLPHLPNTKFHPETKLQLCKSHKIPVDREFLKRFSFDLDHGIPPFYRLQIHADIELDTDNRVVSFTMNSTVPENKDAELDSDELLKAISRSSPTKHMFSDEEDEAIWTFVTVDLANHSGKIPWIVLKKKLKSTRDPCTFSLRFSGILAPTLHSADFDVKTKLKLYKKYQIPVDKDYADILKSYAELEIDENRLIQSYQLIGIDSNDDEKLEEDVVSDSFISYGTRYSPEEDMEMWKFAISNAERLSRLGIWKDFKAEKRSKRPVSSLWDRFSKYLLPNLRNTKFHTETKLKLCKLQRIPVDDEFLEELEKDADVILDSQKVVETFTMKPSAAENKDSHLDDDSFLQICAIKQSNPSYFTPEEDLEIWRHLIDKIHDYSEERYNFWKDVRQSIGSERSAMAYSSRFYGYLAPNLHKYNFDIETKLKLYKICQIVVDKEYLEVLRQHVYLKIGEDGRIVWYRIKGEDTFEEGESEEAEPGDWEDLVLERDVEHKLEPDFIEDAVVGKSNLVEAIDEVEQEDDQKALDNTKLKNIEQRIRKAMRDGQESGEAVDRVDFIYSILNNGLNISGFMDSPPPLPSTESQWSHDTEKENDRNVSDDVCPKITEEVTREEELNIWNYILGKPNCETGSRLFWRDYLKSTIWKNHPSAFMERFEQYIVPNLHKTDLDLKSKLALYKKCQNAVNKRFLKTIPEDVHVKLDDNGCLAYYRLPVKKPKLKKRWSSPEYRPEVKKQRKDIKIEKPAENEKKRAVEDADLIVAKIVAGTGVPNPEKIIVMPPKVEIDDSEYDQACGTEAAGLLKPKEEIIEEEVNWNQNYQMPPEMSAMIAGYVEFANAPLRNQIASLSESLFSLERNFHDMKRTMRSVKSEKSEESDEKEFLTTFKNWISAQKSSKMEEIDRRVGSAIRASTELPEDLIYSIFDNGLKMIGS